MEYSEALSLAEEMKERLLQDALLVSDKARIEDLYREIFREGIRECNCKDRYRDALFECIAYLKRNKTMNSKAKLLPGVVLQIFGSGEVYTNHNLTDQVAREYLKKFPNQKDLFSSLPDPEVGESTDQVQELSVDLIEEVAEKLREGALKKDLKEAYIGKSHNGKKITNRAFGEYLKIAEQLNDQGEVITPEE